jgi:hypothetical protein
LNYPKKDLENLRELNWRLVFWKKKSFPLLQRTSLFLNMMKMWRSCAWNLLILAKKDLKKDVAGEMTDRYRVGTSGVRDLELTRNHRANKNLSAANGRVRNGTQTNRPASKQDQSGRMNQVSRKSSEKVIQDEEESHVQGAIKPQTNPQNRNNI